MPPPYTNLYNRKTRCYCFNFNFSSNKNYPIIAFKQKQGQKRPLDTPKRMI